MPDSSDIRLQNSRVFFLKIKSLARVRLLRHALIPDLLFDCSRVLEYAKIRTVLQSNLICVDGGRIRKENVAVSKYPYMCGRSLREFIESLNATRGIKYNTPFSGSVAEVNEVDRIRLMLFYENFIYFLFLSLLHSDCSRNKQERDFFVPYY